MGSFSLQDRLSVFLAHRFLVMRIQKSRYVICQCSHSNMRPRVKREHFEAEVKCSGAAGMVDTYLIPGLSRVPSA
jgi:CDGSH-type Zn-finger protein